MQNAAPSGFDTGLPSGTGSAYPAIPLHRYVEGHAALRPDAVAVRFQDQSITYGALNRRANQLARHLTELGVQSGTRVAVCIEPSLDIAICLMAIWKVGAVHVPLDPSYPKDRLAVILDDTQPAVVLTQIRTRDALPVVAVPVVALDVDSAAFAARPDGNLDVAVPLEQTAFIIYTSGTTGKPKGVMLTHANLVHYVLVAKAHYGFDEHDVMPALARFTFSITMFEVLSPLVAGGQLIILAREQVLDFRRLIDVLRQSTVVHASPSLLRKLVAYVRDNAVPPETFDRLRHVSSGGDMVSADLLEVMKPIFRRAELFVIYGCSEVACMGCTFPVLRDHKLERSRVGKPFPNVAVRLCDPDGNAVPAGTIGEICFAGAGLAAGYLNRPDLTSRAFVMLDGQRFYRTGDEGRFDAAGDLEILGRSDFQIKLRGIRIELGDVEAALRQAPGVREGIVAAHDVGQDKTLVGYVVPEPGQTVDFKGVRRFLQQKLPDYMVPGAFVELAALPVNINQKVDRRALPAPTPADLARLRSFDPARNPTERKLVAIWERVLGVQPIGVRDSFFEVGGDSLLSVSLMVEIEKGLGRTLPLSTLLTQPTIEKVAALIDGAPQDRDPMVLLRDGGPEPPLFLIHDGEGEVIVYRNLAQSLPAGRRVYGVQSKSRGTFPILHTRLGDAEDYYAAEIRKVQPHGPYLLGGLCVGGFMAFEVARRFRAAGEKVALVALIDAAHVKAQVRPVSTQRMESFSQSITGESNKGEANESGARVPYRKLRILRMASHKVARLLSYEVRSRTAKARNDLKMRALRYVLDNRLPIPRFLENIPVRVALRFAEREYVVPERYPGEIVLFTATRKDTIFDGTLIDDTPYVDMFVDPLLGWQGKAAKLTTHQMAGGHSTMLMEPNVRALAAQLQAHIESGMREVAQAGTVES